MNLYCGLHRRAEIRGFKSPLDGAVVNAIETTTIGPQATRRCESLQSRTAITPAVKKDFPDCENIQLTKRDISERAERSPIRCVVYAGSSISEASTELRTILKCARLLQSIPLHGNFGNRDSPC
jgi:hypothetical protein